MQIVILGMHRSGTSAVTRLIHLMGAHAGSPEELMGSSRENARGFWERLDVLQLDKDLLAALGHDWHRVHGFDPARLAGPAASPFLERARSIVGALDGHRPWVVKDPRLCLLFPFWRPMLDAPLCVLVQRNPLQIAQSLKSRNGFPLSFGLALWEKYSVEALRASSGAPRVNISYNQLISEPRRTAERLLADLVKCGVEGLKLPSADEIRTCADPGLHRERGGKKQLGEHLNQAQARLFNALRTGAAFETEQPPAVSEGALTALARHEARLHRERTFAREIVTFEKRVEREVAAREAFRSNAEISGCELEASRGEAAKLARQVEARAREAANLGERLAAGIREADDLRDELRERERDIDTRARDADELREAAEARDREADRLRADVESLREEIAGHRKSFDDLQLELRKAQWASERAEASRREWEARVEAGDRESERLRRGTTAIKVELARLGRRFEEQLTRARDLDASLRRESADLAAARERIQRLSRSGQHKDGRIERLAREAHDLRSEVETRDRTIEELRETGKQLRETGKQLRETGDQLRSTIDRSHKAVRQLGGWVEQLHGHVEQIVGSRRFRAGHLLIEVILKRLTFKSTRGMKWAPDEARELFARYQGWKKDRPAEPTPPREPARLAPSKAASRAKQPAARKAQPAAKKPKRVDSTPASADPESESRRNGARPPASPRHPATVAIAIHNAHDELIDCFQSVLRHTNAAHPILLIDDASTDERIAPMLREWDRRHARVRALFHETNLGYTATINRACRESEGDVVLLNSDTIVTRGWLDNLAAAARDRPDVATVTPLSNAAGAFSIPANNQVNELPADLDADGMGELLVGCSERLRPEAPTGNGFCMYVTRAALDAAGEFDAVHFPRGYGEENDFCLRASAKGFVHLVEDSTFVYHKRSASYGAAKAEILRQSRKQLDALHPDYKSRVDAWLARDDLASLRARLSEALAARHARASRNGAPGPARPALLYVVHNGKGGTPATTEDLMGEIDRDYRTLLLKTDLSQWTLHEWSGGGLRELEKVPFARPWRIHEPMDGERGETLRRICSEHSVRLAHVRHVLASGPELLDVLHAFGIPTIHSFHDFYTICPTINLLDQDEVYCAGHCTPGEGDCPVAGRWLPELPALKHQWVHQWRERVGAALRPCDAWVTTSRAARETLVDHFPFLDCDRFATIEHGRDLSDYKPCSAPPAEGPVRVVLMGGLNRAKGLTLIEAMIRRNHRESGPFEFHFLGPIQGGLRFEEFGGVHAWEYQREELPALLAGIQPSFSVVASRWPETYCHTLTESWAAGIPVFASDIGTLRERVADKGGGWLLDPDSPEAWYDRMNEVARSPGEYAARVKEIEAMRFPDTAAMAASYRELYARALGRTGAAHRVGAGAASERAE